MIEDLALELDEGPTRLESQLLSQQSSHPLVASQGLALTPTAVQREHQLLPAPFPKRFFGDGGLELGDQLAVEPEREPDVDELFLGIGASLVEADDLRVPPRRLDELGEHLAAPAGQPRLEHRRSVGQSSRSPSGARRRDLALELQGVDRRPRNIQAVAPVDRHEVMASEGASRVRHHHLQRLHARGREVVAPHGLQQLGLGHRRRGPQGEHAREGSFLRSAHPYPSSVLEHLERTKDTNIHRIRP